MLGGSMKEASTFIHSRPSCLRNSWSRPMICLFRLNEIFACIFFFFEISRWSPVLLGCRKCRRTTFFHLRLWRNKHVNPHEWKLPKPSDRTLEKPFTFIIRLSGILKDTSNLSYTRRYSSKIFSIDIPLGSLTFSNPWTIFIRGIILFDEPPPPPPIGCK